MGASIGIVGAGITGLATAYVLSSKYDVTIVARDQPGDMGLDWASPWAGAVFHPQRHADKSQQQMQKDCFKFYWSIVNQDPCNGVRLYPMTEYFDDETKEADLWYRSLMPDYQLGTTYTTLAINPLVFLPWLKGVLIAKGVKFIRAEVKSIEEARSITESKIIVNASGVGARVLAVDEAVTPVRGQTMFVKTGFSQLVILEGSEYTYVIPRAGSGGVIMGGIKSDRLDAEVDVSLKSDILRRVNRLTNGAFEGIDLDSVTDVLGFRPGRNGGLRVERDDDVIHAYGVEGAGYIYSFGVAEKVGQLIEVKQLKANL
ncbi:putative FAD dependent oxidoreductase [Rhexocercosporidium sp. MPI-PUGE-AT-0058]|nr:putative FAD dependent oxidoreductase [Rhexocercosporidium sp. MPI-PUGE-AT-0058]